MADEVVGKVTVEVEGDTRPLKRDIRQAAQEAGAAIQPEMASEIDKDTSVTEAIVEQVEEAEKPAEQSSRKIGRAVIRGTRRGVRDGEPDLSASLDRLFVGMGRALEREAQTLSAGFKRMGAQVRSAFDDEAGNIQKASSDAGATITPNIARGINQTPAITEAIVGQVEDAVQPADQHGEEIGRSVIRGARRGVRGEEPTLRQSLDNLFAGMAESLERETPLLTAGFHRIGAQVRSIFQDEAGSIQQDIADAADAAGADIGPTVAAGINKDAGITDAIVGQVTDAVTPSEDGGIDVGHAVMRGAQRGVNDEQQNLSSGLGRLFDSMGRSLERQTPVVAAGFRRMTAQVRAIFTDETSAIGRVAQQAGSAIGPEIAAGIDADSSITDVIVKQVEDAVIPAEQAGGDAKDAIVQGIEEGLAGSLAQAVGDAVGGILPEIDAGISGDTSISTAITSQISAAQQPAEDAGHDTGIAAAHGVEEGLQDGARGLSMDQLLKDMFDTLDDVLRRRTDETAKKTRVRIQEILRAGSGQRGSLMSDLLGPESMAELEAALARFKAVIEDENGRPRVRIDEDSFEEVLRDIDAISERIIARFEHQGSESSDGFQRGFQKSMKKAVSGGIFDALFKMLAGKVAGMGALVSFGIRAAAPIIVGLTSQITTAVVGLGEALGGLGIVGAGIGATLLPNMVALKFAMKGLDTDTKKALSKNFKEAAGDLAKFPDILRSTLIPRLLDAVRITRQLSPEISAFGRRTGEVAGDLAKNFAAVLGDNRKSIDTILTGSTETLKRLGQAATSLVDPLIDALAAMQPLINRAVNSIASTIERLATRLDSAVTSGRFLDTLERWYESGLTLLQGFKNLGVVVKNFFGVANNSQGNFVKTFEKFTGKWADWTESIEGKNTLRTMFAEAKPVVEEVWKLLGDVVGLFTESFTGDTGDLVGFIRMIRTDFVPMVEDLQDMVRDSGIQDALYDLADAFVDLVKAGGGGVFAGFVTTLGNLVEILADLLNVFGPVLGPFLAFVGGVKALSLISGKGFSLIGSLPGLLGGLVSPASSAQSAVKDLNDEMQNLGDAAGGAGGKAGKFSAFMTGLASKVNVALTAIVAMQAVVGATSEGFSQSETDAKRWADAAKEGALEVKNEIGAGVGPNFWEKWAPGGIITSLISGENPFAARNFGEELASDLGTGFQSKMKEFAANVLGIDFGNLGATKARIEAQFGAIQTALEETGDVGAARTALAEFEQMLKDSGVSADVYADSLADVNAAIEGTIAITGTAVSKGKRGGLDLFGDFTSEKTALESIGLTLDKNLTDKIDAIRANSKYKDPLTGGLNPQGLQAVADAYAKANKDMINGLDDAISKADAKTLKGIVGNKNNYDKFGNLTREALEKIAVFLPDALERNEAAVETHRKNMEKILESEDRLVVGRRATREFGGGLGKLDKDVKEMAGEEIIRLRTEWENQGFTEDQIEALIKDRYVKIVAQAETVDAFNDLGTLLGGNWQAEIKTKIPEAEYIEVEGKLLHLTEEGKWEAVVGTEAETARAEEDIYTVTKGKDGDPWTATIKTHANTKGAEDDLDDFLSKQRTVLIDARINQKFLYYVPGKGYVSGGALPKADLSSALIPPAPAASMISMGGPTMGGDGASIGGFGISARGGGGPSIGTYASNGRYSSNAGSDDDELRRRPSVTVINNYPEPERVSDSIAMSLRLARWEMAGA